LFEGLALALLDAAAAWAREHDVRLDEQTVRRAAILMVIGSALNTERP
jgi:hypothetical protein